MNTFAIAMSVIYVISIILAWGVSCSFARIGQAPGWRLIDMITVADHVKRYRKMYIVGGVLFDMMFVYMGFATDIYALCILAVINTIVGTAMIKTIVNWKMVDVTGIINKAFADMNFGTK